MTSTTNQLHIFLTSWSTSHQKTLGLGVDWLPFKVRYNDKYNKSTSYFFDIMMLASCVQGEFIALTNVSKGAYYTLKNHDVAYVKKISQFLPPSINSLKSCFATQLEVPTSLRYIFDRWDQKSSKLVSKWLVDK